MSDLYTDNGSDFTSQHLEQVGANLKIRPLSRAWLNRFRFGPAEWLWRSLAYGARQPMLRGGANGSQ